MYFDEKQAPLYILPMPRPPSDLSPNARVHWTLKAKQAKKIRYLSKLSAELFFNDKENFVFGYFKNAIIKRVFYFKNNIRRDKDNFEGRTKAVSDGLVDAKIIVDDNRIIWLPTDFIIDPCLITDKLEYHIFKLY